MVPLQRASQLAPVVLTVTEAVVEGVTARPGGTDRYRGCRRGRRSSPRSPAAPRRWPPGRAARTDAAASASGA